MQSHVHQACVVCHSYCCTEERLHIEQEQGAPSVVVILWPTFLSNCGTSFLGLISYNESQLCSCNRFRCDISRLEITQPVNHYHKTVVKIRNWSANGLNFLVSCWIIWFIERWRKVDCILVKVNVFIIRRSYTIQQINETLNSVSVFSDMIFN